MSDIVERLRAPAYWISGSSEGHEGDNNAPVEAAAEIERLRAQVRKSALDCLAADGQAADLMGEVSKLRAALREIADHTTNPAGSGPAYRMVGKLVRTARAALEERT